MIEIISNTPIYVWPLLIYLFWGGWKSKKTHIADYRTLCILPAVMFLWSIYSMLTRYGALYICVWAACIAFGIWLGLLTLRKLSLRFDKKQKKIEISGSWVPIIVSMSIFSFRYALGATYGLHPEYQGNPILLMLENCASIFSGILVGRLVGYWRRYQTSSHSDLALETKSTS